MEQTIKKKSLKEIVAVLEKRGYHVQVLNNEKEVKDFINESIPDKTIVGLGNSITTCRLNLRNLLAIKGSQIFYSWDGSENYNRSIDTFEPQERPDYYITRINALTKNGQILMKDYDKNTALKGNFPSHIMAFVGLNRVVDDFDPSESTTRYTVFNECPGNTRFVISLLPFLDY